MPEGRYRPLLCLVQIAAGERDRGARPARRASTRRRWPSVLADPEVEIVVHAGRQDVAILRREWETDFTNVFDTQIAAGFAGFSAQAGYNGLLHDVLQDPAAEDGELHALGRAAADRGAARATRAATSSTCSPLADEIQRAAGGPRPARVGARGVPRDRRGHRRARSRRGLAAAAARQRAGRARPRGRARARRLARAHRGGGGPPGRLGPARPDRGRAGQAPAGRPPRAGADPRRQPGRRAPPRARRDRGDRARPGGRAGPSRRGRPHRRPSPSTGR